MTRSQRRWHLVWWLVLTPVVAAVVLVALKVRPAAPSSPSSPTPSMREAP